MTPLDALLLALHAAIDRRCAAELLRTRIDAQRARRSLGQSWRWLRASVTR